MSRTVLLIAGTFPPQEDVGGLRPAMFAKYLPTFGWRPIVLTRTYPVGDVNHKPTLTGIAGLPPASDILAVEMASGTECLGHNGLSAKARRFFMPEYGQSWDLIERMVERFLAARGSVKIDAIYATSPSFGEITVGVALAARLRVPLLVDFRDIVEQDVHEGLRARLLYLRHLVRRYWATRRAFHAIAVSDEQQRILARRLAIPVTTIVNGYDEAMFLPLPAVRTEIFLINYVGRILGQWLRDPTPFFTALDRLHADPDVMHGDIQVRFYGCEDAILHPLLVGHRCQEWVTLKPRLDYAQVPILIGQSGINLVLTNRGRTGVLTTKFFEYLAVRRPILCVPDDGGALATAIATTRSGLASAEPVEIAGYIKRLYLDWKSAEGLVPVADSKGVEAFSRRNGACQLATLLDAAVQPAHRPCHASGDEAGQ